MTLYTTLPLELVLQGVGEEREPPAEIVVQGIRMQVEPVAPGIGKIVRLLDCALNDYLNPAYAPGSLVHYGQAEQAERR